MATAAFNFERAKLSGKVSLSVIDLETTILEIPSRFTADSANVGRVMFRARVAPGQTRGSAIVRIYNDAEDGQIVRQSAIGASTACVVPIDGGITVPTVGGMRVTAEMSSGTAVIIEALVDPSTGAIPSSNPFSVVSPIAPAGLTEFGPAPMDCTRCQVMLASALVGNCELRWLDAAGAAQVATAILGGQEGPIVELIPAGGFHLAVTNGTGGAENVMVSWS